MIECLFQEFGKKCGHGDYKNYECINCKDNKIENSLTGMDLIKWRKYQQLKSDNALDKNKKTHQYLMLYVIDNIYSKHEFYLTGS